MYWTRTTIIKKKGEEEEEEIRVIFFSSAMLEWTCRWADQKTKIFISKEKFQLNNFIWHHLLRKNRNLLQFFFLTIINTNDVQTNDKLIEEKNVYSYIGESDKSIIFSFFFSRKIISFTNQNTENRCSIRIG